jgi:hypothetical protein
MANIHMPSPFSWVGSARPGNSSGSGTCCSTSPPRQCDVDALGWMSQLELYWAAAIPAARPVAQAQRKL